MIADPGDRANALLEVVRAELRLDLSEPARANATKAAEAAKAVVDQAYRWQILLHAASALTPAGDRGAAIELIKQAREEILAFVPPESLVGALRQVAEISFYYGDRDQASDTVEIMEARARAMQGGDDRPKALQDVARTKVFIGDYDGALKFALDDGGDFREIRADLLDRPFALSLRIQMNDSRVGVEALPWSNESPVATSSWRSPGPVDSPDFSDHRIDLSLVIGLAVLGEVRDASKILDRMGDGPSASS